MPVLMRALPPPMTDGRIKTLNNRGFTTSFPDPLSLRFVDFAAKCGHEVLDFGCAFGVASLPALQAGAHVCACDMDAEHLEVLERRVDPAHRARLTLECAAAPEASFQEERFGAILSSRVFHFLAGDAIDVTLAKMYRWLRPGGRLFLIADTPYAGVLRQCVPQYLERKARGERWPGFIGDYGQFMPRGSRHVDPPFINLMDPEILSEACQRAAFTVEESRFMPRIAKLEDADPEGRDHVGLVAVRL